jgi:beta-glucosidase
MTRSFPDGFTWSTATAAHQIEGGNWNNDWWLWEHNSESPCVEPSGDCCDSYHRYRDDHQIIEDLGFDSYRFSLEWSRIEPEEGEFSVAALDHYKRVCEDLRERGVTPVVTFHHFTTPRWVAHHGGWEDPDTADRFARYCERATRHLGELIGMACTINEPNMVATHGFLSGAFPPGRRDAALRRAVNAVFCQAHRKGYEAIKSVRPDLETGLTIAMEERHAVEGGEQRLERIFTNLEDVFLDAATGDDFVGVQTYTRMRVGPDGALGPEEGVRTTLMGYEFWPEALEATIRTAWERTDHTPIVVTENGIGTDNDDERIEYVQRALEGVLRCLADGIEVRGYTYWSLLDNFEWALGYGPTFGLVAVDRTTFERAPKASARWLSDVIRANAIPG